MEHSSGEIEFLQLLKELQQALAKGLNSLGGKTPMNPEAHYMGFVGKAVNTAAEGFPDPKTRKAIEEAAIAYTKQKLREQGFHVESHEKDNLGYDLHASGTETLFIEVKGTSCSDPRFFLTRNEFKLSLYDTRWRLFVVCNALINPVLQKYTAEEMFEQFAFSPLAWQCTKKV